MTISEIDSLRLFNYEKLQSTDCYNLHQTLINKQNLYMHINLHINYWTKKNLHINYKI